MRLVTALVTGACVASVPALEQQESPPPDATTTSDASEAAIEAILPAGCRSEHTMSMPTPAMPAMTDATPAQQALIATMASSGPAMMAGMMAPDPDLAFVCAMIAHHQGAIDMAKAELANGADDWAKGKAQADIDTQQAEIAEMTDWVGKKVAAPQLSSARFPQVDRGREGFGPPRPPNRTCGFPAYGSPVGGFLIGTVSRAAKPR